MPSLHLYCFFFFNDTATTEIYTLSLHDALPISILTRPSEYVSQWPAGSFLIARKIECGAGTYSIFRAIKKRSEEHTSELQSQSNLVCRLLLEKKKKTRLW